MNREVCPARATAEAGFGNLKSTMWLNRSELSRRRLSVCSTIGVKNMGEWFQQRYISRDEHDSVVAYYKKLVVHLHRNVRDLREKVEAQDPVAAIDVLPGEDVNHPGETAGARTDNVIVFDFRCRH